MNVEGKTADLAFRFAVAGQVTIIFGTIRHKFRNDVPLQFVSHLAEKVTHRNARLVEFPSVDDRIGVVVQHLLLEDVEVTIELEAGPTGGERGDKDVGLGTGFDVVVYVGINHFHDVINANA